MPYTEAAILEVQRMASVLPIIVRSNKEDTSIDKYFVPKVQYLTIINFLFYNFFFHFSTLTGIGRSAKCTSNALQRKTMGRS